MAHRSEGDIVVGFVVGLGAAASLKALFPSSFLRKKVPAPYYSKLG
jgi:hypothetical protein